MKQQPSDCCPKHVEIKKLIEQHKCSPQNPKSKIVSITRSLKSFTPCSVYIIYILFQVYIYVKLYIHTLCTVFALVGKAPQSPNVGPRYWVVHPPGALGYIYML